MAEAKVEIWTDGASKGNPGPGGWGALLTYKTHRKEIYGGSILTTNNQMELTAAIEAFKSLKRPCQVKVYTDSQYVLKGITQWIWNWQKKGWRTGDGPVKNKELWQALLAETQKHTVEWEWVRGHDGNLNNEKADELANKGVEKALREAEQ